MEQAWGYREREGRWAQVAANSPKPRAGLASSGLHTHTIRKCRGDGENGGVRRGEGCLVGVEVGRDEVKG